MVVVLPAPFGPRKPKTWPGGTLKVRPSSATTGPNLRLSPISSRDTLRPSVSVLAAADVTVTAPSIPVPAWLPCRLQ